MVIYEDRFLRRWVRVLGVSISFSFLRVVLLGFLRFLREVFFGYFIDEEIEVLGRFFNLGVVK